MKCLRWYTVELWEDSISKSVGATITLYANVCTCISVNDKQHHIVCRNQHRLISSVLEPIQIIDFVSYGIQ